ncbi:MAG: SRPBCC domain-containing protein [Bacteroidales bacterium]
MKEIHKYYILPATPEEVYIALTNSFTIELWTDEKAVMSTEEGSEFSLWDGSITGRNISFIENRQIQQEWFFGEQVEKSVVTIKLFTHRKGTSCELRHTNVPDSEFEDISDGWDESYFGALIDFFNE